MIEINLNTLQKSETRVPVKGHQTKSGYVKPHIRVVKAKTTAEADVEMDAKMATLQTYKAAATRTNDWIKDNPDRYKDVGSISDYTVSDYDIINSALRDDFTEEELSKIGMSDQIKYISSFIKDVPKYKGKVYRGMNFDVRYGGDIVYEEFMKNLIVGCELELKPFTSTSFSEEIATKFTSPKNINILMEIQSKRGVVLNGASEFGEQEILFDRGSKFKIIDVQISGNDVNVKMEEI